MNTCTLREGLAVLDQNGKEGLCGSLGQQVNFVEEQYCSYDAACYYRGPLEF